MLTIQQAFKSKTNWGAIALVAVPEIWNMAMTDPSLAIPPNIKHDLTLLGAAAVILFRTMNTQGGAPSPPQA